MLVPIPWEPGLYVHPDMLARLRAIEASLGRVPYLFGQNSAWRSYAQQKALWGAYENGTGNIASNPDTGNRTHMRGVAVDLQDTSLAMQRACVRAGLQRDPAENWHWQLPNWADYPIIPKLPSTSTTEKSDTVTLYYSTTTDKPSTRESPQPVEMWALAGDSPGTSANWLETKSQSVASGWAVSHGSAVFLTKASFANFKARYLEPLKVSNSSSVVVDSAAIAKAVNDDAARRMAQ